MVASAEAVARREPSGENLMEVMPLPWALAIVSSASKRRALGCGAGRGEYRRDAGLDAPTEEWVEVDLGVKPLESLRRGCLLGRCGGLLSRQYLRPFSSSDSSW